MAPSLVHQIRVEAHAVWLAVRDPRTPLLAKIVGMMIAGYALSPIDLIPDFVPVFGLVDDAIFIPMGVWLFTRMISPAQFAEHRAAAETASRRPVFRLGIFIILAIWAFVAWLVWSSIAILFD